MGLEANPQFITKLEQNRKCLYHHLNEIPHLTVSDDIRSSIAFLYLKHYQASSREEKIDILDEIAYVCQTKGVLLISTGHVNKSLHVIPEPAIRVTVTAVHSLEDIKLATKVLKEAVEMVCGKKK